MTDTMQATTGIYCILEVSVSMIIASLPTISFLCRGWGAKLAAFTSRISSSLGSTLGVTSKVSTDNSAGTTSTGSSGSRWGRSSRKTTKNDSNVSTTWSVTKSGTYEANAKATTSASTVDDSNLESGFGPGAIRVKQDFDINNEKPQMQ